MGYGFPGLQRDGFGTRRLYINWRVEDETGLIIVKSRDQRACILFYNVGVCCDNNTRVLMVMRRAPSVL